MSKRISQLTAVAAAAAHLIEVSRLSSSIAYTASTISAQASDNSLNDSAGQFLVEGFVAELGINIAGFTGAGGNNANAVIVSATANKLVLSGVTLADDAAGESVTVTGWESARTTAQEVAALAVVDADEVAYTPAVNADWDGSADPGNVDDALDQLAERVADLEGVTPLTQGTGLDVDAAGFRGIPQNSQSGNYTTVAADAGKHLLHPSGGGAGDTFTIDSNANVAYEVGTAITFVNMASDDVDIAITSDTLTWAEDGSTGTRTLAQYGIATAVKVTSTGWLISGTGLS
jgi:hypothetical protein